MEDQVTNTPLTTSENERVKRSSLENTIIPKGSFASEKAVQKELKKLHDDLGLAWTDIQQQWKTFEPIPGGTLSSIYHTGKVPHIWKDRLLKKRSYPPRIAIHKEDMESAARSIVANLSSEKVLELVGLLSNIEVGSGKVKVEVFVSDSILPTLLLDEK